MFAAVQIDHPDRSGTPADPSGLLTLRPHRAFSEDYLLSIRVSSSLLVPIRDKKGEWV